jgi:hypothetical protein
MIADRFFEDGDNYELRMMAGSRNWDRVKHLVNTMDGTGNDTVRSRGSREETEDGSHYDKEIIRSRVRADYHLESMPDSPKHSILTGKVPMYQNQRSNYRVIHGEMRMTPWRIKHARK